MHFKKKKFDQSGREQNKIWVDKGKRFFNISMEAWLEDSNTAIYSTHNEEKSAVAERLIRFLENKN